MQMFGEDYRYLEHAAQEFQRKKRERQVETTDGRSFTDKVLKVYGSTEAYTAFKATVGMADEQARRFEKYGILLQPMQLQFSYWARQADLPDGPREIAMGGARGPGKSYGVLAQAALDDCQRFPGLKVLYLRKTATAAQEQFADLIVAVLGQFPNAHITGNRIRFPNGSVIIVGGFKDDAQALTYQGVEYDVLIIEEATQLSERTYKALRLSERSSKVFRGMVWRPRTYVTFNPLGIGHQFFKERFVDPWRSKKEESDRKFIFGRVVDNAFVNEEYIDNLRDLNDLERRAYLDGDWDVSAGAYFRRWSRNRHVIAPLDDVKWMDRLWLGMDYGYNHWNMTYLVGKDGDGVLYSLHELAHRHKQPDEIVPDILAMLDSYGLTLADIRHCKIGSDAFNKTGQSRLTIVQQYTKLGMRMLRAETAPGSRVGRAQFLNRLLGDPTRSRAPGILITENCPRLINCLPYLEVDPHNQEDVLKVDANESGRGGDDPYDALCYAIYTPREARVA